MTQTGKIEGPDLPVSSTFNIGTLVIDGHNAGVAVSLSYEDGEFFATIISPKEIDAYGVGASQQEAVNDLLNAMRESYAILRNERGSLSQRLIVELAILKVVLGPSLLTVGRGSQSSSSVGKRSVGGNNRTDYFPNGQGGRAASS